MKYTIKPILLFFFLLLSLTSLGQDEDYKWFKITKNDVFVMSLQAISGVADGFNQAIVHHKYGKGNPFLDNKVSWTNKWEGGKIENGEKFFGSSTVFVFVTDGFHLTRFIDRGASVASVVISVSEWKDCPKKDRWKLVVKKIILSYGVNRTAFTITYNSL